jgi:hypothetical protein
MINCVLEVPQISKIVHLGFDGCISDQFLQIFDVVDMSSKIIRTSIINQPHPGVLENTVLLNLIGLGDRCGGDGTILACGYILEELNSQQKSSRVRNFH